MLQRTVVFLEAATNGNEFDFLLKQILFVHKQNDRSVDEPTGIANGFKKAPKKGKYEIKKKKHKTIFITILYSINQKTWNFLYSLRA